MSDTAKVGHIVDNLGLTMSIRSDTTLMDAQVFDRMMANLDHPDPMPGLTEHLADATPYASE